MGRPMGMDFGLEKGDTCFKMRYRWLFKIPDISASGTNSLPPEKAARPSLNFKEMEVQHLNETLYYPSKPDWKPINLTLYDIKGPDEHPVFKWLQEAYNPCDGKWKPSGSGQFKKTADLELYDGCGNLMELWTYENIWPQNVEFGELDMSNSEYVTADVSLRYDRAFIADAC
jgi:hypothetical protein